MGKVHIGAWAAAFDSKDCLWLSDFINGGLCKYNLKSNTMDYVNDLGMKLFDKSSMHRSMIIDKGKIVLCPFEKPWIQLFDINTNELKKIDIPYGKDYMEYNIGKIESTIYLFSEIRDENIYIIDIDDEIIKKDDYVTELVNSIRNKYETTYSLRISNKGFFLFSGKERKIYSVDIESNTSNLLDINGVNGEITDIFYIKGEYWVILENSFDVYSISESCSDSLQKYTSIIKDFAVGQSRYPYSKVFGFNDEIVITNYYGNSIRRINRVKNTVDILLNAETDKVLDNNLNYGGSYWEALRKNGYLFFISIRGGKIIKCNELMEKESYIDMIVDLPDQVEEKLSEYTGHSAVLKEGVELYSLKSFLKRI